MKKVIYTLIFLILVGTASATVSDNNFEELPTAWETGEDLRFEMTSEGSGLDQILFQSREPGEPGFTDRKTKSCTDYSACDWNFDRSESETRTFEYRFRIQTTSSPPENTRYQQVTYYNNLDYSVSWTERPPSSADEGDEIEIGVRAEDDADRFDSEGVLSLQYRDSDGDWTSFDSRDCSSSSTDSSCSNTGNIDLEGDVIDDEEAEFRGFVEFKGGVTAESSVETVEIDGEEASVDDVEIDDLPSSHPIDEDLEITGEADGENLDEITLEKREEDDDWEDVADESCSGDNCDFEYDYDHDGIEEVDFRLRAEAGDDEEYSDDTETVDFYDPDDIDEVDIEDLPSEHPVGDDLEIEASAEGEDLDELEVQESDRDEDDWSQVEDYDCDGSDNCDFEADYTADEEEEKDFRVKATSESGGTDYSSIEEVDFVEEKDSIDNVDIEEIKDSEVVGTSVWVNGSTSGRELDAIAVQKKRRYTSWSNLSSDSCSGSNCEIEHEHTESSSGDVEFRIKAWAGTDTDTSGIEVVTYSSPSSPSPSPPSPSPDPLVSSVSIDNLPDTLDTGTTVDINGSARGNNISDIFIQKKRRYTSWSNISTEDCGESDYCQIDSTYTESSSGDVEFRIKANAGTDTETSGIEVITYSNPSTGSPAPTPTPTTSPIVSSVMMDELPNTYFTYESLNIEGSANGNELDQLTLQKKPRRFGSWINIEGRSCSGSSCSLSADVYRNTTGNQEYRFKAEAGTDTEYSGIEVVQYRERGIRSLIDSIGVDSPDSARAGDEIEVNGTVEGSRLERLDLERKSGDNWVRIKRKTCTSSPCSIEENFSTENTGIETFRAKVYAGGDSLVSDTTETNFYPENRITSVNIDNLPSRYETDTELAVSGSAEGDRLENISIQAKKDSTWESISNKSCSGTRCSIDTSYNESEESEVDFRTKAYTDAGSASSSIETVSFVEEIFAESPTVTSVNLEELPDRFEVGEELGVEADATGRRLNKIKLQTKERFTSWTTRRETECTGSTCTFEGEFTGTQTGNLEFRALAEAGDHTASSNIEVIEFYGDREDDGGDDETEGDAELEVEVEDEENNNLEDARVRVANGDSQTKYTNSRGDVNFDLETDEYTVTASKPGYETDDEDIEIEEGETESLEFHLERLEDFDFTVSFEENQEVCVGSDFTVDVEVTNYEDSEQEYTISGTGLGGAEQRNVEVDSLESDTFELVFEDVEQRNEGRFTVEVQNNDGEETVTVERQVELDNCEDQIRDVPSGISANINPRQVLTGEVVRIKGDVQGVRVPVDVTASSGGFSKTVSSTDSGSYTIFHTPETPGEKKITISSEGVSTERTLEVLPRASVSNLYAPRKVVQGQNFEICAQISSQSEPEVILFRDGDRIDSKTSSGRVCFETRAGSEGEKNYWIRAATSGETGSANKKVEVIPAGEEFDTFPGQVAVEKTEPAQAKMTLYNKDPGVKTYQISVEDFQSTWVSFTDRQVNIPQGETREVYFYFSPEKAGTFNPVLMAETSEEVFEKRIDVHSQEFRGSKGWNSLLSGLF